MAPGLLGIFLFAGNALQGEFFGFLFSKDDLQDTMVTDYKKKIKLLFFALLGLIALFILIGLVT